MQMEPYQLIKHLLSTEKSHKLMEAENKLVFVVDKKASKQEIKKAVEQLLKVKVLNVNTHITKGQKKAYVKLDEKNKAIDVASQFGIT